jgi:hypothetical protein
MEEQRTSLMNQEGQLDKEKVLALLKTTLETDMFSIRNMCWHEPYFMDYRIRNGQYERRDWDFMTSSEEMPMGEDFGDEMKYPWQPWTIDPDGRENPPLVTIEEAFEHICAAIPYPRKGDEQELLETVVYAILEGGNAICN